MIFCTGCGKPLHESAPICPQCGKPQQFVMAAVPAGIETKSGPLWAAIASLVLGIVFMLGLFDDSDWDEDTATGFVLFAVIGLVLGIVSLNTSKRGRGMAIAGIVLSAIGLLIAFLPE